MSYQNILIAIHAIEFNIDLLASIGVGIKMHCLNSNSQVEVDYFKRSVEDITHQPASEILANQKINYLLFLLPLKSYSFILL